MLNGNNIMDSVREFLVQVEVPDPVNFCADADSSTLSLVRNTYEGKCYKGVYINKIIKIEERGQCTIPRSNLDAHGTFSVRFSASVRIISVGDIITGVRITMTQPMGVALGISEVGGKFMVAVQSSDVSTNQYVSVVVVDCLCNPMVESVSVIGTVLTAKPDVPCVYKLRGVLTRSVANDLKPLAEMVKAALSSRAEDQTTHIQTMNFLEGLMYGYKGAISGSMNSDNWKGPPSVPIKRGTAVNLLELIDSGEDVDVSGFWSRPNELHMSSPFVCKQDNATTHVTQNIGVVFQLFLKSMLNYIKAVEGELRVYNSKELLESHNNIWVVRRLAQTSV